jgi:hypothetical protein
MVAAGVRLFEYVSVETHPEEEVVVAVLFSKFEIERMPDIPEDVFKSWVEEGPVH